eukprot:COSAG04_NODE_21680_length_369_cov_1.129630_1_plen_39_part_10
MTRILRGVGCKDGAFGAHTPSVGSGVPWRATPFGQKSLS